MTAGSSATGPCTSEIASVTVRPAAAAANRPPLIDDSRFRTHFSSAIAAPAFISARAVRIILVAQAFRRPILDVERRRHQPCRFACCNDIDMVARQRIDEATSEGVPD